MLPERTVKAIDVSGLDARVRVFGYGRLVDSFAIQTERFTVIVDTMDSPETMSQVWDLLADRQAREQSPSSGAGSAMTERQVIVVNTHGDWDHAWGNCFFDGPRARVKAPILGHHALRHGFDWDSARAFLSEMREKEPGRYESVEIRLPTIDVGDRCVIRGGDLDLEIVETPGHTPDHVAIWVPELRLLIAGDAAEMPVPFVGPHSDVRALRRSLHFMKELNPRAVLYSHGGGFYGPELIESNIRYFDTAEKLCREWVSAGRGGPIMPADLDWPLEAILPAGLVPRPDERAFFERSHELAISAVADSVTASG